MNILRLAHNTTTAGYVCATAGMAIGAYAVRVASSLVPYSLDLATAALEWLAMGLFLIAYLASWVLLPIGAIRPINRFTIHGCHSRRIVNVALAVILLVALHVAVGLGLAAARS